jgi:hypothetical protein
VSWVARWVSCGIWDLAHISGSGADSGPEPNSNRRNRRSLTRPGQGPWRHGEDPSRDRALSRRTLADDPRIPETGPLPVHRKARWPPPERQVRPR